MRIENQNDERMAYGILKTCEEFLQEYPAARKEIMQREASVKRSIRRFQQRDSEITLVRNSGTSVMYKIRVPKRIRTEAGAREWFKDTHFLSPTLPGAVFTSRFKIAKLHGQFFAYHEKEIAI